MNLSPDFFQEKPLPEQSRLVGWAALCQMLHISAPIKYPACASNHHIKGSVLNGEFFRTFDKRYWPGDAPTEHLDFALKYENLEMICLKRALEVIDEKELTDYITAAPNGKITRKLWYYFENFTGRTLNIPDLKQIKAEPLLNEKNYFTGKGQLSGRHRVYDNHLGTLQFTPLIRRTKLLENYIAKELDKKTAETMGRVSKELIGRASSFLLLADSQASFAIEGERPPKNRLERWGKAVLDAGRRELSLAEFERLHNILVADDRFIPIGLRHEEVFIGERDRLNQPLPEFIGAAQKDLDLLISEYLQSHKKMMKDGIHPVLHAVATAFGFVYIHPLQDGNGRLHRYLLHDVLASHHFTPGGFVFPLSSAMLERIDKYRAVLQAHSGPLMNYISWEPNDSGNVKIINETADLYRYYDCTEEAEFIFNCIEHTIEVSLPQELDYLKKHDRALERIMATIEMPDQLARQFILFVRQNDGTLSKRRREKEFAKLSDSEIKKLETIIKEEFEATR